jgi:hypothetical protein
MRVLLQTADDKHQHPKPGSAITTLIDVLLQYPDTKA